MYFTGNVIVRFKKSVLEPQGKAIEMSLGENGFKGVSQIRVGKSIEVTVDAASSAEAEKLIREIAEKMLFNPVMEHCEVHMVESP